MINHERFKYWYIHYDIKYIFLYMYVYVYVYVHCKGYSLKTNEFEVVW